MGRLASGAATSMLGMSPEMIGAASAARDILNPEGGLSNLFAAMQPFEQQQTRSAVAGTREAYGSLGGRFSKNASNAEALTRGQLANTFALNRQQAIQGAQATRANFLSNFLSNYINAGRTGLEPLQMASSFLAPGAPQYQQGIIPGLLGAGGNLLAAKMFMGAMGKQNQPSSPGAYAPPRSTVPSTDLYNSGFGLAGPSIFGLGG